MLPYGFAYADSEDDLIADGEAELAGVMAHCTAHCSPSRHEAANPFRPRETWRLAPADYGRRGHWLCCLGAAVRLASTFLSPALVRG